MNTASSNNEVMAEMPCVLCQGNQFVPTLEAPSFDDRNELFRLIECSGCGLVRTSPFLEPEELAGYYSQNYYGTPRQKFNPTVESLVQKLVFGRAGELYQNAKESCSDGGAVRVLDVGCGRGNFLRAMNKFEAECVGTELPGFQFPRENEGIEFLHGELRALEFPSEHFHLVNLWHVLEHLRNPAEVITEVARILKPNGMIAIAVPNFGSFQSRLFQGSWFHLDLPRHLYHFSQKTLCALLSHNGLRLDKVSTLSLEQNLYGFVQSTLNKSVNRRIPNELYALLKSTSNRRIRPERAVTYFLAAALSAPAALLEFAAAHATSQGATLIVYARKHA